MGRQLRSILPSAAKHLRPVTVSPTEVIARRQQAQSTQKMYHDCTVHHLPPLKPGNKVHVQLSKGDKWTPAQVTAPSSTPRSYQVQTDDGRSYRRNRLFMKPRTSPPPVNPPERNTLKGNIRQDAPPRSPSPRPEPASRKASTPPPPGTYITRSGRSVKTRLKMDLYKAVKFTDKHVHTH